jgi:hypothetical protein
MASLVFECLHLICAILGRTGELAVTTAHGFAGRINWQPADRERKLERLRFLARFLDTAIRLPNGFRFGADSLIGLVPGLGDAATTLIACYFVYEGYQLGLPPKALAAMVGNVMIDALLGSVPLLGDLFDTVFKANVRNLQIIEKHFADT